MDDILKLITRVDNGDMLTASEITQYHTNSKLLKKLTNEFKAKPLYAIWRLGALSEIPYAKTLTYTNDVVSYIFTHLALDEGFTYTGSREDIVPCYNGMIVEALCKLGYADSSEVQAGIQWILDFQLFKRELTTTWDGKGILRHGGCLGSVPCYIGIVKSLKTLLYYRKYSSKPIANIDATIDNALHYVLNHKFYQRLSTGNSFNKYALTISFPTAYMPNAVEFLELAYLTDTISHNATQPLIHYLKSKQREDGYWSVDYLYTGEGYIGFDGKKQKAEFSTYYINQYLGNTFK